MTGAFAVPSDLTAMVTLEDTGLPVLAPRTIDEAVSAIRALADAGATALLAGSGSTLSALPQPSVDAKLSSTNFTGIVDYEPDDLTIVARTGTTLAELNEALAVERQTAVLPEVSDDRTVGGVVASAASGYRRLRYGPTRDRVLGVTLVTGYGQPIKAGGALVKNVTGYDLSRLSTGSHGSLGFIAEVCLKLWPRPPASRTVEVDDAQEALGRAFRPLAVLETPASVMVMVEGSEAAVAGAEQTLGGASRHGLAWPAAPESSVVISVRVPAASTAASLRILQLAGAEYYVAQHGVGLIDAGFPALSGQEVEELRIEIGQLGGIIVITRWAATGAMPDRWGMTPDGLTISSRLTSLFDPSGVFRVGQLPGGL